MTGLDFLAVVPETIFVAFHKPGTEYQFFRAVCRGEHPCQRIRLWMIIVPYRDYPGTRIHIPHKSRVHRIRISVMVANHYISLSYNFRYRILISFSLDMRGATVGKAEKVKHMLEITGLEKFRNDYPAQLSGGMAQRVALVRTLINEPEILLLDEPLGALDAFTRMNMQDEILNIWTQRRQLALMVTHSIDEAVYMGTRVLVMEANPGRIVADIKISEDFPRDRSSASFVEYRNEILNKLHYGGKNA